MNAPLRPMTLGEILDRTFQIYRERFWVFVGIAAIPAAIIAGVQVADFYWWHLALRFGPSGDLPLQGRIAWGAIVSLAYYHIAWPIRAVFSPAMLKQSSGMVFGEAGGLSASLGFALRRWLRFLWIGVILLAVVLIASETAWFGLLFGLGSAMDAMGMLKGDSNGDFIFLLLFPLLCGFGLFLWLQGCFSLAAPACAFEEKLGFKAMGRSWRLSREGRWRVALTWFLIFLFNLFLSEGINLLLRWGIRLMWTWGVGRGHMMAISAAASYVVYTLLSAAVGPLFPIAVTLFYYDQRIRKEGFDIEYMMQSAGMTAVEAVAAGEADGSAASMAAAAVSDGADSAGELRG